MKSDSRNNINLNCDISIDYFKISIESMIDCFGMYSAIRDEENNIIDFRIDYLNDAACEFSKMSNEKQIGKRFYDLFPAYKRIGHFQDLCKTIEKGQRFAKQLFIFEDTVGTKIAKVVDFRAVKNGDGFMATWRDITEEVSRERALKISEDTFRGFFEASAAGIGLVDLDLKYFKVNNSMCRITGYSEDELIGMNISDITHPDDCEKGISKIAELIEGKIPSYQVEKRYIHRDGHIIWAILSVSIVRDVNGIPLYFAGQFQDTTEIKKANEMLERDRLRTDFFATVSHEFKTPLNIIMGSLQLINSKKTSNENQMCRNNSSCEKYIGVMKQNCYRLLRLINNLIDITRIDSEFLSLNQQNCDIVSVIEDITQSVVPFAQNMGVVLTFDTEIEEKIIACDIDKIERILLNLLSNAIKFTEPNGSIEVNILDKQESLIISVKDTGIGIPEDKLNVIFERFRQVDSLLSRKTEGSGIGLSLVKSLVEQHEGKITVNSQLGKGSEFLIELPIKLTDEINNKKSEINLQNNEERVRIEFSDIYS